MSMIPRVRGNGAQIVAEGDAFGTVDVVVHRRRASCPRKPFARKGRAVARVRRTSAAPPPHVAVKMIGHHDFGDGRHAIEFEGPSLDLMLYHDRGVTLAEWVSVDGRLLAVVPVGEC